MYRCIFKTRGTSYLKNFLERVSLLTVFRYIQWFTSFSSFQLFHKIFYFLRSWVAQQLGIQYYNIRIWQLILVMVMTQPSARLLHQFRGDYLFTWSIPQLGRRYSYSSIIRNGSPLLSETVGMGSVDGMDSASQTIALHLSAGDRVWIKYQGGNNVPYIDKHYNGVFTGFLLW